MDPISKSSTYIHFMTEAKRDKKVHVALGNILDQKIQDISKSAIGDVKGSKAKELEYVNKLMPGLDPSHQKTALLACRQFLYAYNEITSEESKFFSVEKPSPVVLQPVSSGKKNLPYTLLENSVRPMRAVVNSIKVFNVTNIRDHIPLKPQRLLLHKMTVKLVSTYQFPSTIFGKKLKATVPKALAAFNSSNSKICETAEILRKEIETDALLILKGEDPPKSERLKALVIELQAQAVGEGLSTEDIHAAISQRAADTYVNNYLSYQINQFNPLSSGDLDELIPLTIQTKETRRMFMVNGGIASGKGTATDELISDAKTEGVEWNDVLMLNSDAYKNILLDPSTLSEENKPYFSGLTHDEASLIRDGVFREYKMKLSAETAPHLFVDQNWPAEDIFELGGRTQNGLDVTIVQIPVHNSFKMAYARGTSTSRYEARQSILDTHRYVPLQLGKSIAKISSANKNVRIRFLGNVAKGVTKPLAFFDFGKKTGKIDDLKGLLGFYKKTSLNSKAQSFNDLYIDDHDKDMSRHIELAGVLSSKCSGSVDIYDKGSQTGKKLTVNGIE